LNRLFLVLPLLAAFPLSAAADDAEARLALRRTPIVAAVAKVQDCVVNISTEPMLVTRGGLGPFATGDDVFDRFFQDFFSGPAVEQRKVNAPLGSGCVITSSGLVITNEHVVRRASNVKLSLNTGETFDAVVLAADPAADLALLRAQTSKPLQAMPMGVSSDLMLGEPVVAVGNPFGFENSVTSGIVSALNREIAIGDGDDAVHYTGLIQTSALINPGNSGGPLVNILGELIGINSAIVEGAQGVGFAIPIDRARDVLAPLLATPQVCEAWTGVRGATVPGRKGARVTQIEARSPAEKVLQVNDVIASVDGRPLSDLFDFFMQIVPHKPGDAVALHVERGGQGLDVQFTLGQHPQPSPRELLQEKFGLTGSDLTPEIAQRRGTAVDFGVYATQVAPDGPAHRAGLDRGDVIVQIGSNPVRNLRDAAAALRTTIAGERVVVVIVRQNFRAFTRVTVGNSGN
jgi:serine protease Do